MDEKFMEFWGNLLINAAQGKKQSDEMFRWLRTGFTHKGDTSSSPVFPDFTSMAAMFKQFYGMDQLSERSEEYKDLSKQALNDFQESFDDYMASAGLVSKKDHLDLVEKYEKLKTKCADQEETVKHLKMMLSAKKDDQIDASEQFQDMVRAQGDFFQNMMKDFGQYFQPPEDAHKTEGKKPQKGNQKKTSPAK